MRGQWIADAAFVLVEHPLIDTPAGGCFDARLDDISLLENLPALAQIGNFAILDLITVGCLVRA